MPSIKELGLGIGDWVSFNSEPHAKPRLPGGLLGRLPEGEFTLQIVALADGGVYLYPGADKLGAWKRVQNTQTGEINVISGAWVDGPQGKEFQMVPLAENERLVIAMDAESSGFFLPKVEVSS